MLNGKVEILGGRARRRRWAVEEKLRMVAEADEPGACVRAVVARHNVYPNLLHCWRRQVREGRLTAADFVPVRMLEQAPPVVTPASSNWQAGAHSIQTVLPDGWRLRVGDAVGLPLLCSVIRALRR